MFYRRVLEPKQPLNLILPCQLTLENLAPLYYLAEFLQMIGESNLLEKTRKALESQVYVVFDYGCPWDRVMNVTLRIIQVFGKRNGKSAVTVYLSAIEVNL